MAEMDFGFRIRKKGEAPKGASPIAFQISGKSANLQPRLCYRRLRFSAAGSLT
jgi:hypothetical protein